MYKIIVLIQAVLVQLITSQCACNGGNNWAGIISPPCAGVPNYGGSYQYQNGLDLTSLSASNTCGLSVTSSSPMTPGNLAITSENVIEGPVSVYGQLPFLSAVAFEAAVPSYGYGTVGYNCGNGNVAILSEGSSGYGASSYNGIGRPGSTSGCQCACNGGNNWAGIISPPCAGVPNYGGSYQYQNGLDLTSLSASNTCGLSVTSSSPMTPGNLAITSENVIEGPVSVYGQLPFLSAVAFEAAVPSYGYGTVGYNCGNGNVAILSEGSSGYGASSYNGIGRPGSTSGWCGC
ncbi:unnamed protein product [Leptosia nina]|uniref:Uncharacterized protein n=1 Tax=Leptosia nina TaxID=320188 RepID=A0AAV1JKC0_9NEOP